MLRLGLVGYGHLGKIHAKCTLLIPNIKLVGVYDADSTALAQAKADGYHTFSSYDELLTACEAVNIVTPTSSHYELAVAAINQGLHIFVEKPITNTVEEAMHLEQLVTANSLHLQVGHVERFNPAMLALQSVNIKPAFIEGHRLATFNPRGTDVSVVLDLMIHDLDLILHLTKSKPISVQSHGVSIVSKSHDICNARIQFENGCVVNLTASRISLKQMRKLRIFQSNAYISMDFLDRKSEIVRLWDVGKQKQEGQTVFELDTYNGKKAIELIVPEVQEVNAIKEELASFAEAVQTNKSPEVGVRAGRQALELAFWIMKENQVKE